MSSRYRPFRNIRTVDDLLLVRRELKRNPASIRMPAEAYYPEICAWVQVRCREEELFSPEGQTLLEGVAEEGEGWRLSLTEHGYLQFEGGSGDDRLACESPLPVHAVVDARREFRLGFAMVNYAWSLRDRPYAVEGSADFRLRLLASPGPGAEFSQIGGRTGVISADLAPVPDRLTVGARADGQRRFAGRVTRVVAYNTSRAELLRTRRLRSAARALPIIPGGGGFQPRWVDEETVEVFTRPSFNLTSSYWVFLRIADESRRLKRMRVWVKWRGGVNMTPTFFWSRDRKRWRRIVPARVWMGDDGTDFRVEFELTGAMREGGYLASCPPFGEQERMRLLDWAREQSHTTVSEIGESVEGRPVHLIRVAQGEDGSGKRGVAVICGQHSPLEIMGGHVIEPSIRRVLARPRLLEACNFYFVPTVNVDCAHYGGNGLNANRCNNNRHWFADIQPENAAVIGYFDRLKPAGQSIDFAVDIHAGGIFRNHVLMHMGASDEFRPSKGALAEQEVWRDLLEEHAGLRRCDARPLPQLKLRATDYFHQVHGSAAFCLELSSCSYFDPQEQRTRVFGSEAFETLAQGLVRAWEERFCDQGRARRRA
jgi:hypothetical protein